MTIETKEQLYDLIALGIEFIKAGGTGSIHHVPNSLIEDNWKINTLFNEDLLGENKLFSYTEITIPKDDVFYTINLFFENPVHKEYTYER